MPPAPEPPPAALTEFPPTADELAALMGGGMQATDIQCIYRFQSDAEPILPVGQDCPTLATFGAPTLAATCGGLMLPDERCLAFTTDDQNAVADDATAFNVNPGEEVSLLIVWRSTESTMGRTFNLMSKIDPAELDLPMRGWQLFVGDTGAVGLLAGSAATAMVETDLTYDDLQAHVLALNISRVGSDSVQVVTEAESTAVVQVDSAGMTSTAFPFVIGRNGLLSVPGNASNGEVAYVVMVNTAVTKAQIDAFFSITQ